jgi:hypothetical protein
MIGACLHAAFQGIFVGAIFGYYKVLWHVVFLGFKDAKKDAETNRFGILSKNVVL